MTDLNEIRIARAEMQRRLRKLPGCEGAIVTVTFRDAEYVGETVPAWHVTAIRTGEINDFSVGGYTLHKAQSAFYDALRKIEDMQESEE